MVPSRADRHALLLVFAATVCCSAAIPATVTVAADASPSERHAAAEVARILNTVAAASTSSSTSTHFAVVTATKKLAAAAQIAVGSGAAMLIGVPAADLAGLGLEGFLASTSWTTTNGSKTAHSGSVVLSGGPNAPRGSLYAVNYFVESLGVHFLAQDTTILPTALPAILPTMRKTFIPELEYRQQFEYACNQPTNASVNLNLHLGLNKDSLGAGGTNLDAAHGGAVVYAPEPGFVHTSFTLVPPDQYKAAHPDWFAGNQLCWKAAGLKEFLATRVATLLRKQPNANIISVSQNDGYGWCQTGEDQMETEKEGSPMAPLLQTINFVADSIKAEFPHVAVDTLAYLYTLPAPNITRPRDNVIIRLCSIECNFGAEMTDLSNAPFQKDMTAWSKISQRTFIWNYQTNFQSYLTPFPNYFVLGPNVQYFAGHGVRGIFQEGSYNGPGGDMAELRDYVTAKMMFDPSLDSQQLIGSFISGYYGSAAGPHIMEYLTIMHQSVANTNYYLGYSFEGIRAAFLTPDVLLRSAAALSAAKAAAAADSSNVAEQLMYSEHVNRSSLALWYVALHRFEELLDYAEEHHVPWPMDLTLDECFASFANAVNLNNAAYYPGPGCVPTVRDPCGRVVLRESGVALNLTVLHEELFQVCQPGFNRNSATGVCTPVSSCSGDRAQPILPQNASASNVDGRSISSTGQWEAGAKPPQWIQLANFARTASVATEEETPMFGAIEAVVNMAPDGFANHSIFVDGVLIGMWAGNMTKGQVLSFRPAAPFALKDSVRILTSTSPSFVAWYSITVYSCFSTAERLSLK